MRRIAAFWVAVTLGFAPAPGHAQMPEGAALATRLAESRAVEAMIWGMPAKPLFDKTWKLPDAERLAGW